MPGAMPAAINAILPEEQMEASTSEHLSNFGKN